jgi:hypothetical protein
MTRLMPMRRCLLLAFFGYVILDLGCPLVHGAFSFDPAQSVDAVSAYRARPSALARVAPASPPMTADPVRVEMASPTAAASASQAPVVWRPHAGPDDRHASDARPSVDDD